MNPGKHPGGIRDTIIVTGIVLPNRWAKDGRTAEMVLFADDESEFVVNESGPGKDLAEAAHCLVRVAGKASTRRGRRVLDVKEFEIVDPAADWDEDGFESPWEDAPSTMGMRYSKKKI